jgi:hypothetical protein
VLFLTAIAVDGRRQAMGYDYRVPYV